MVNCVISKLLNLFFPERCVICDSIMKAPHHGVAICSHCIKTLIFLDTTTTCRICGCQIDPSQPLCTTCQSHQHYFDRVFSCFPYKDEVREAILRYKFHKRRDYCRGFGALLTKRVAPIHKACPIDAIVNVPLTKAGFLERGYNQTELLAERISRDLSIPFWENAFLKIRETKKQSLLSYRERFENIKGAFSLLMPKSSFKGKHILLVDDVLTTGATADALSKLLREAGADRITVVTIATTGKEDIAPVTKKDELLVTY